MSTVPTHIADLANAIAGQAEAIRDGKSVNPVAAARLLQTNAATLLAWLERDAS